MAAGQLSVLLKIFATCVHIQPKERVNKNELVYGPNNQSEVNLNMFPLAWLDFAKKRVKISP